MNHWLLKSDPETYGWNQLVSEGKTRWDGVRNFQARNNLRAMAVGDRAFFYHSNIDRAIVGEVEIVRSAYADPTAKEGDWSCVDIRPTEAWDEPVSLERLRAEPALAGLPLIRQGQLSVMPVSSVEWKAVRGLRAR